MWTMYLTKYWKELAVAAVVGIGVWYVMNLRADVLKLTTENILLQNKLDTVYEKLESNYKEYQTNLGKYESQDAKVTVKWKTRIETVYVWGDKNVSCEDAMSRFDSTIY